MPMISVNTALNMQWSKRYFYSYVNLSIVNRVWECSSIFTWKGPKWTPVIVKGIICFNIKIQDIISTHILLTSFHTPMNLLVGCCFYVFVTTAPPPPTTTTMLIFLTLWVCVNQPLPSSLPWCLSSFHYLASDFYCL